MIHFQDFVPKMLSSPGIFKPGEYESFDAALMAANQWIQASGIDVMHIETVVLPNIWSRWEEGSKDVAIGSSGDMVSHWHQFIRVWFRAAE